MPGPVERELARLRRLAALAVGIRAFGDACLVVGLALGTLALAARFAGVTVPLTPFWLAAFALPVAWALVLAVRERMAAGTCAAHLDRRLGMDGLLLATLERDGATWNAELRDRLAAVAAARRPRLRPWRGLGRTGAGIAFVLGVALLPPPQPDPGDRPAVALQRAVEDLAERVEQAVDAEAVTPARAAELEARVKDLEERLMDGEPVAWSDVDALQERLAHEQAVQAGGLAAVRAGARALSDADSGGDLSELPDLRELAERAAQLGLGERLPEDLRATLEALARAGSQGLPTGASDLEALGLDAEQLRRLGEALEQAVAGRMRHAAQRLPPDQLGDLRALLEEQGTGGTGLARGELPVARGGDGAFDPTPGPDGDGPPGRGGVNRGRADATLEGTHTMDVDTETLRSERLPPGAAVPDQWQRLGVTRAEPEVGPQRSATGAGARAADEDPGAATWRRRLAPHHQETVRRFFTTGSEERR